MVPLVYLHGKDSSPFGFRANYIRDRYPKLIAPELTANVSERSKVVAKTIQEPAYIVGSSLGGLSALIFCRDHVERVKGLVLLAPAVGFHEAKYRTPQILDAVQALKIPADIPTTVIGAIQDEVIPIDTVRDLVQRSPDQSNIRFYQINDRHSLRTERALDLMMEGIDRLYGIRWPGN
jgi:pimeloyl-ACP methyl ester carboxylesterase